TGGGRGGARRGVGAGSLAGPSPPGPPASPPRGRSPPPADPFVATVYEMLGGGIGALVLGLAVGERVHRHDITTPTLLAWLYLVVMGSLIGFTAYAWLLRQAPISQVVTHQYVNPLVAITLGALLLGERLTVLTLAGAGIVIGAVFVTVRHETRPPTPRRQTETAANAAAETA